ncbi:type 4a pilus biogenesis protein PilO [Candidatus Parcubacteria bacterium]|nr:type 4a pilus biogenesis protein PilO [Candidatus Parcubacteria bacterium]
MVSRQTTGLVLIAAAFIAAWVFVWPLWTSFQEASRLLNDARVRLNDKQEFVRHIAELQKEYEANQAEARRASLVIPVGRDIPGLLETVSALATVSGVSLDAFGFSGGQATGPGTSGNISLPTIAVNMNVAGSYEAIKGLLRNIEQNIRLFETETVIFGRQEDGLFSAQMKLNAYYQ